MIRVYITGPARDGLYPYRVEGHDTYGGTPIMGRYSGEPLLDACRVLASLREPGDHLVGLFHEGNPTWLMRTSVAYGSRYHIEKGNKVVLNPPPTYEPPATPEAPPPPPSTPQELLTDTGPATPAPASPGKSRHRHRQGGSGARRGSR